PQAAAGGCAEAAILRAAEAAGSRRAGAGRRAQAATETATDAVEAATGRGGTQALGCERTRPGRPHAIGARHRAEGRSGLEGILSSWTRSAARSCSEQMPRLRDRGGTRAPGKCSASREDD